MSAGDALGRVRGRIAAACAACGRDPASVRLVAVSKTAAAAAIRRFAAAGQPAFAENRAQDYRDKQGALADLGLEWHFIGSIQTNKIKYFYKTAALVHSVDRRELIEAFAAWGRKSGRCCPFLLEVHISDEASKHGFAPGEVLGEVRALAGRDDLDCRGLMGMAPFVDDPAVVRAAFAKLGALFRASREVSGPGYRAQELSMGMSDDFPLAIAEGATLVRIGRALFAAEDAPEGDGR